MTALLEQAMREVQQLPDSDQDAIAARILDEIHDDRLWHSRFAETAPALQQLADHAWAQHESGETIPLDDER